MEQFEAQIHAEVEKRLQKPIDAQSRRKTLVTTKFADELTNFLCKQFQINQRLLMMPNQCARHAGLMSPT